MSKLPAFQFYPGDWRKDMGVQSLSYHDRGVWWELLCLMHDSEQRGLLILNGTAMSEEALSRLLGLDKQILTTTLTTLLTTGVACRDEETGAIMSRRMVRDENLRQIRAEAGKMGGNPTLLKQKTTTGVKQTPKQKPTPSSSSSVSSSVLKANTPQAAAYAIPDWIPAQVWAAFELMRKQIRKPLTDEARRLTIKKLDSWRKDYDPESVLNEAIEHSWTGIWQTESSKLIQGESNGTLKPSATKQRVDGNRAALAKAAERFGWTGANGPSPADGRALPEPGLG